MSSDFICMPFRRIVYCYLHSSLPRPLRSHSHRLRASRLSTRAPWPPPVLPLPRSSVRGKPSLGLTHRCRKSGAAEWGKYWIPEESYDPSGARNEKEVCFLPLITLHTSRRSYVPPCSNKGRRWLSSSRCSSPSHQRRGAGLDPRRDPGQGPGPHQQSVNRSSSSSSREEERVEREAQQGLDARAEPASVGQPPGTAGCGMFAS